jgi:hypothetical protein
MPNTTAKHKGTNSRHKASDQIEQLIEDPIEVGRDVVDYLREYAKENPETAALWCFGIGFVLGWKLKIW